MNQRGDGDNFYQSAASGRQMALIAQLVKIASSIDSIDTLFNWLAHAIISRYNVHVVQFWVAQAYRTGHISTELRTIVCQDTSLPKQLIANSSVAEKAEQLLNGQGDFEVSPVGSAFRHHQAVLFSRYGLHYCSAHTLHRNSFLPPPNDSFSSEKVPTHLSVAVLLFLHQTRSSEWLADVNYVLKQAIQFGETRGLLLPPTRAPSAYELNASSQQPSFALTLLVPHRKEDANLLSRSNPLTDANPIRDKQARRLYAAVDGHKSVMELCNATRLTLEEAYKALQILLSEQRIRLFGPQGEPVDPSQILSDR
jgi:hypothetical protein